MVKRVKYNRQMPNSEKHNRKQRNVNQQKKEIKVTRCDTPPPVYV